MYDDEIASINSEMRFITLELMKLAEKRKKSFKEVVNEFISNAFVLDKAIRESSMRGVRRKTKALVQRSNARSRNFSNR